MSDPHSFVEKIVLVHRHLEGARVRHAFGGAIALAYHVESPRATADIDVNITAATDDAGTVLEGLPSDVRWAAADLRMIKRDGQVRLFWERTPVDLFFPQHELHDVVAARVQVVPFGGAAIPVISATDLTIFKTMFNRTQDWADIEAMLEYGEVDRREVRRWLDALLGPDDVRVERFEALIGPAGGSRR